MRALSGIHLEAGNRFLCSSTNSKGEYHEENSSYVLDNGAKYMPTVV